MQALHGNRQTRAPHGGAHELIYAASLFVTAATAMTLALPRFGFLDGSFGYATFALFFLLGFVATALSFDDPKFGRIEVARTAQIAALLVLGPVAAAAASGGALLGYRLLLVGRGPDWPARVADAMYQSATAVIAILAAGWLYTALGGPLPATSIDAQGAALIVVAATVLQLVVAVCELGLAAMRQTEPPRWLLLPGAAAQLVLLAAGITVAVVFLRVGPAIATLVMLVFGLGLCLLRRYARHNARLNSEVERIGTHLRARTEELDRLATIDELTGLPNRRYAEDVLERELEHARRHDRPLTVALVDIDALRRINERYSDQAGDRVLKLVADLLRERCRRSDLVARIGGDEFLLCLPDTRAEAAERVCRDVGRAARKLHWASRAEADREARQRPPRLALQFGIAEARIDDTRASLLALADTRLSYDMRKRRIRVVR